MPKERGYTYYYDRLNSLPNDELLKKLVEKLKEMSPYTNRNQSTGFKFCNESSNNMEYSVIVQLLEERQILQLS